MCTAKVIAEAMANWNKLELAAREKYPNATADEIYDITKAAMESSLGIDQAANLAGDGQ